MAKVTTTIIHILLAALISSSSFHFGASSSERQLGDFIDRSCDELQVASCELRSNTSCTSLKEALVQYYNLNSGKELDKDTPYPIFSMFDLFYSGILNDTEAPTALDSVYELNSQIAIEDAKRKCAKVLKMVTYPTKNSDHCRWNYECLYNPNYFPSFTIKAKLNESSAEGGCEALSAANLKFVKTNCLSQPGTLHWCPCDAGIIATGYSRRITL